MMDGMYNQLQLIEEVKKRPILYSLEKHHDKDEKFALWKEVGAALFAEWHTLNKAEVYDRVLQIQRKWRSLRDAYNRELRGRRSGVRVNRCVYRYFKPLSFLGGFDGNISDTNEQEETTNQTTAKTTYNVEYIDPLVNIKKKRPKRKVKRKAPSEDEDDSPRQEIEMPLFTMDTNENESDSDRLFLLSFVQEMKQLPVNIKMWARAQIANVMQEAVASQFGSSSILNTVSDHTDSKVTAMPIKIQRLDNGSTSSDEFKSH